MVNDIYWLWLQKVVGTAHNIRDLLAYYGSARKICEANEFDWRMSGVVTQRMIDKMLSVSLDNVYEIIDVCNERKWEIVTYEDEKYPKSLRKIVNPPCVLFMKGEMPDLENSLSVAVVGSRNASEYAMNAASFLSSSLASGGAVIVSGGAPGVDRCSHEGAMVVGAKTVCVLGTGLDSSYPEECSSLRENVAKNGCLITEYPPFSPPIGSFFSARNRIISALSDAVVVVEARPKSGSLVTARYAREQGKQLFAIPGSIVSQYNSGTNEWLSSGKARPVFTPQDVARGFYSAYPSFSVKAMIGLGDWLENHTSVRLASDLFRAAPPRKQRKTPNKTTKKINENQPSPFSAEMNKSQVKTQEKKQIPPLKGDVETIYNSLTEDYRHIDIIINESSVNGAQALAALTQLELMGLAVSAPGRRYRKG